ncbi:MAG: hypothetical protein AAB152_11160 [Candidatus Coatesbacteria bacterium]
MRSGFPGPAVSLAALLLALAAHLQHPVVLGLPALRPDLLPIAPLACLMGLARSGGLLVLAAAVLAGWWAWGREATRWLARTRSGWPFELAAGLMAGSLAAGGLGFAGLLFRPVLGALLVAAVIPAVRVRAWRGPARWLGAARWPAIWPALCLFPAVPWLVVAPLLPVTGVDMLEYHAGFPVLWGMLHRIHFEAGNLLCTMPLGFERLAVPLYVLGAGGAVAWTQLILLAAAGVAVASALDDAMGGWLVAGFGAALLLAWQGHPDIGLVFAAALAVRAARTGRPVETGLACALAAFSKYQGAALAAACVVSTAPWDAGRRLPRWLLVACAVAVAPNLAWLARNAWLTGNPVYPFASHVFPSLAWTDWNSQVLWASMPNASVEIDGAFPEDRARQLAMAFWAGTKSVFFSPYAALVYICPAILLVRGVPPLARRLAVQGLVFGLVWLLPIPKFGRYLVPGLIPVLGAWWLVARASRFAVPVAAVCLGVEALVFVVNARETPIAPERVLTGTASAAAYRRAALGGYQDAVDWLNAKGFASSRTLVIGQGYGMGLSCPWSASNETGRPAWLGAAGEVANPVRMRVHLRQANVTTVLYNPIRAYHRHPYALGYDLSEPWLMAWGHLWRRWARVERPPDSFDWTGAWWIWRLDARPGAPLPQAWLPGAERLYLDETALRRGEADPGRLALQRRVAGDFGVAWFQRSMLTYHGRHDAPRAVAEVEEAIRRGFVSPGALNALGVYLDADGRIAEAARRFREALALDPGYDTARANLTELLARSAAGKR